MITMGPRVMSVWVPLILMLATADGATAQARQVAAPAPVVWDLDEIFPTAADWDVERRAIESELSGLSSFRGRLGESAAVLAEVMERTNELRRRVSRVSVFASLLSDEDTRIQDNLARRQQAQQLAASFGEAIAWLRPELIGLGAETVERFIRSEPRLAEHAFNLRDAVRFQPHTLSAEGERVVAAFGAALAGPQNVYTQMANSDIPWPTVSIDGREVRIDNQGYVFQRAHSDRDTRRRVFDAFYATWAQYESTLGRTLAAHVQGRVTNARLRNFAGSREAALFANNLPVEIYDMLVSQTREGLPLLHRYFRLRARMLGVDDLAYHDLYPDLLEPPDVEYDLHESARLTLAALEPLGSDYLTALRGGLDARWMHAYPAEGKTSGAYVNSGVYGLHPYLLLNHQNDFASLSTFAHEWGHAVHAVLAQEAQPYATAAYSIFVAEMASTINELLLLRYLQAHAVTPEQRLFFLSRELESYRATFFRQAMFGEFEARFYALAEQGEALTGERLTREYLALLEVYHGTDDGAMTIDPAYAVEWAYIPHFYLNFYVFQYATSIAASAMFTERLIDGTSGASEVVVDMLRRGGSAYPYDMFVEAGVDLATPTPYQTLLTRMSAVMDEMEEILGRSSR
jgi:oligoendopeptidase F